MGYFILIFIGHFRSWQVKTNTKRSINGVQSLAPSREATVREEKRALCSVHVYGCHQVMWWTPSNEVPLTQLATLTLWADSHMVTCFFEFHRRSTGKMFCSFDLCMTLGSILGFLQNPTNKIRCHQNEMAQRQECNSVSVHINILLGFGEEKLKASPLS